MAKIIHSVRFGDMIPYQQFLRELSEETCIHSTTTKRIVKACFRKIHDYIEQGIAVNMTDFGLFMVKKRKPFVRRSVTTGKKTYTPSSTKIYFQPTRKWTVEHEVSAIDVPDPSDIPEGVVLADRTLSYIANKIGRENAIDMYGKTGQLDKEFDYRRRKIRRLAKKGRNDMENVVGDDEEPIDMKLNI